MSEDDLIIWEGIYDDFPEEDPEHVFDSEQWIEKITIRAEEKLRHLEAAVPISENAVVHEYPLPVLVALAPIQNRETLRILDFGGGMGATYFAVAASVPNPRRFDYHIVESSGVCRKGRKLFRKYENIHFHEQLPDINAGEFDIVHAASSFQYVKDWRNLLEQFALYKPQYIAFGNLLAGAIRSFVTFQHYYGHKIPVRFNNLDDVLRKLEGLGYKPVYKSLLRQSILGKRQPLPLEHMPEECRLKYGCNLICERSITS